MRGAQRRRGAVLAERDALGTVQMAVQAPARLLSVRSSFADEAERAREMDVRALSPSTLLSPAQQLRAACFAGDVRAVGRLLHDEQRAATTLRMHRAKLLNRRRQLETSAVAVGPAREALKEAERLLARRTAGFEQLTGQHHKLQQRHRRAAEEVEAAKRKVALTGAPLDSEAVRIAMGTLHTMGSRLAVLEAECRRMEGVGELAAAREGVRGASAVLSSAAAHAEALREVGQQAAANANAAEGRGAIAAAQPASQPASQPGGAWRWRWVADRHPRAVLGWLGWLAGHQAERAADRRGGGGAAAHRRRGRARAQRGVVCGRRGACGGAAAALRGGSPRAARPRGPRRALRAGHPTHRPRPSLLRPRLWCTGCWGEGVPGRSDRGQWPLAARHERWWCA
jgi:hypothetical protein